MLFHIQDDRINVPPWDILRQADIRNPHVNRHFIITGKENPTKIMQQVKKHLLGDFRKRKSNTRKIRFFFSLLASFMYVS